MNLWLRRTRLDGPKASLAILLAGCCLLLTACGAATPADPSLPLTIRAATVQAWHSGPITGKLQAAITAQAYLGTTRLYFDAPPQIIFIGKMSLPSGRTRHMPVSNHRTKNTVP